MKTFSIDEIRSFAVCGFGGKDYMNFTSYCKRTSTYSYHFDVPNVEDIEKAVKAKGSAKWIMYCHTHRIKSGGPYFHLHEMKVFETDKNGTTTLINTVQYDPYNDDIDYFDNLRKRLLA